jgi:hypothetical protein
MADDKQYLAYCKEVQVTQIVQEKQHKQDLILFSQARALKDAEAEQKALIKHRHMQFNNLVQLCCRHLVEKLIEALYTNKDQFTKLFCATKGGTQFEMSLCFNEAGTLDTDPKPKEHG